MRTTNLEERSFGKERRRKVIPGFWTRRGSLKLVFSVPLRASKRWNRIPMDEKETERIRRRGKTKKINKRRS